MSFFLEPVMYDVVLQKFLRRYEPLKDVQVGYSSEIAGAIAPFLVRVHGFVSLHGAVHQYETELDMRLMNGPADLERFAGLLIQSFEQAAHKAKGLN